MKPKMGRPTNNPKGSSVHVRLDSSSEYILERYTQQKKVSKAEAIRHGIKKLENDIKK